MKLLTALRRLLRRQPAKFDPSRRYEILLPRHRYEVLCDRTLERGS